MVGLAPVKFLLVDDNHHMLRIVETILQGFGARKIVKASGIDDALHHLGQGVDIIITDYTVGGFEAVDFARTIRESQGVYDRFIPIILLTAHSARWRIEAARDAGITEMCCKPVTPRDLFRRIVAVVDYQRPFVLAPHYIGPDRRRRTDPVYSGPERRNGSGADMPGAAVSAAS